jgi:(2Fe-2S) ferredoxin
VAGVVSFYSFFSTVPRGKYVVRVCLGTACYVRGGNEVLRAMKDKLGIDVGGTTADRQFSLEVGRCFGACGMAPVLMVNDDLHQRVKPAKLGELLKKYRESEGSRRKRRSHERRAPEEDRFGRRRWRRGGSSCARTRKAARARSAGVRGRQLPGVGREGDRRGVADGAPGGGAGGAGGGARGADADRAAQLRRIDPERIEDYIARDGYAALAKVLGEMTPEQVVEEVKGSGPARPRRRAGSRPAEVGVHPQGGRATRSTCSATPTRAIRARSWTAACWKAIRTA